MGAAVALPMLDAMVPALGARAAKPTPRLGFIYIANGVIQNQWNPATTGAGFELTPILQPFANVRDHINVLSGLSHLQADTFGDGTGDHPRASAVWLTGVHAYDRTQPGVEVRLATTADQMIAQRDRPRRRGCRRSSWRWTSRRRARAIRATASTSTPCRGGTRRRRIPTESHPAHRVRAAVRRRRQRRRRARRAPRSEGSILDSVRAEASRVDAAASAPATRRKLGEYLESVREVEQRIQNSESQPLQTSSCPSGRPTFPERFDEHTKLMFDLQVLAFRADITRVFSMIMSRELSTRTFAHDRRARTASRRVASPQRSRADRQEGEDRHPSGADAAPTSSRSCRRRPDGDGSLLDHSLILYGGGMGDGNLHRHADLPCLMAGKLGGAFKTGRHLSYPLDTPMANLLLTVLDKVGVPIDKLGDSTGRLPLAHTVRRSPRRAA